MVSAISMLLASMLWLNSFKGEKIQPNCDLTTCGGYYRIKTHTIKKPNIELTNTKVKITEGEKEVSLIYVKRNWLTIFCYDGTQLDPNTGCYESVTSVNPSCSEARQWIESDKCPTGYECRPDGDCISGDAWIKCFDKTTMITDKGPKTIKWEGTRFTRFSVHTCVSSWECNSFVAEVPTFTTILEDDKYSWSFYDKDNREHKIEDDIYENGIVNPTGELLCLKNKPNYSKTYIENADCFAESSENIKCIVKGEGPYKGIVFDVSNTGEGTIRNLAIKVMGPLLVPHEGKIIDMNGNRYTGYSYQGSKLLDRQRAVNVETAHELAINANILQLQTLYNILSLGQEIDEIYNVLIKVIKSQSIDDPILISNIMLKQEFASKWINPNVFETCPCVVNNFPSNSNCQGDKMYSYGSYVQTNDTSKCFYMSDDEIKNITLVYKANITSQSIKYLPPQTASSDSASWDALNNYRNELLDPGRQSHSYENLKDKVANLENSIFGGSIKSIFTYATYTAAWASLVTLILNRVRRG